MKKTIRVYGLISGGIASILMVLAMCFHDQIGFDKGMLVGYTGMIISLSMIFFAIQSYKKYTNKATISFKESFKIGMGITLISAACYSIAWMIFSHFFMADYMQQYINYEMGKMRQAGASAAQIQEYVAEANVWAERYNNPIIRFFMVMLEPLPVGLLMTLVASFISMSKHKAAMRAQGRYAGPGQ